MKRKLFTPLSMGTMALALVMVACGKAPQLTRDNVDDVLAHMTLDEKINIVVGAGNETFTGYGNTKKLVPGAAGTTSPIPRLGIPPTALTDGPAGLRIDTMREGQSRRYYHTGFPIGTALASSWNQPLIQEVGEAIGNEAHEYGLDLIFGPGMNLHRDPLGGRNFEYYSEDPLLTGKMAAAFVRGIQSQHVGATLKHFAVNNQETNRKDVDVRIAQRPLRELYLKPFEIAVRESDPWSVMSAYNMINGQQCMESRDLLTTILRGDFGFRGFVVSDWAAPGWRDSGREIWAGNDLLAPGTAQQRQEIKAAVKAGTLSIAARAYDPLGYAAIPELTIDSAVIARSAQTDDVAIITIGRSCGEGADRLHATEYLLSDVEHRLIAQVSRAFHAAQKRVIVVLNVSGVVEVASWRSMADAVVLSWLPGQEAGDAVCRVLTGKVCPSGRLTMTFPLRYEDCSTHDNFPYDYHGPKAIGNYPKIPRTPAIKNVHYVDYVEGMYVGYRYFDTFNRPVAYPFGFGLSYTTFAYSDAVCRAQADGNFALSVKVTNTGACAGKEVVQVYAPVRGLRHQLVAFGKTRMLQPGESQTLSLTITQRDLACFDEAQNAWVLDAGDYTLEIGANARDARLKAHIQVSAPLVVERVNGVLR